VRNSACGWSPYAGPQDQLSPVMQGAACQLRSLVLLYLTKPLLPVADLQTLAKLIPAQSRMVMNPASLEQPSQAGNAPEMDLAMVPTSNIRPGDIVRVLPGERMPVDGDIIQGKCSVDESMLTGESVPVPKSKGQQVWPQTCCTARYSTDALLCI